MQHTKLKSFLKGARGISGMKKRVCIGSNDLPTGTQELSVMALTQAWFCMSIVSFPHTASSLYLYQALHIHINAV